MSNDQQSLRVLEINRGEVDNSHVEENSIEKKTCTVGHKDHNRAQTNNIIQQVGPTNSEITERHFKSKNVEDTRMVLETNLKIPSCSVTLETLSQRRMLDMKRWFCISRPQYVESCGISSLVSCWNYLFSTLGSGTMKPITQEEALTILNHKPPFEEINFGKFTGNVTLMRWFQILNDHFGVQGTSCFFYKLNGENKTFDLSSHDALLKLKKCLKEKDMSFIYHAENHYFCPIGFEDMAVNEIDAYKGELDQSDVETWILIGDSKKNHPCIHCIRWEDIITDLKNVHPDYIDVRRLWKGALKHNTEKPEDNDHCIMAFRRN
ncbi:unnamed protein product [Owenia fusiformis]|uniref:Uncharacterized protein n=1 Tax=Owenia fusiformis TaxID=6347 RepID=A0A8J1UA73_OWEFU|nr:unnamed protein product [Owenia fusiformis]